MNAEVKRLLFGLILLCWFSTVMAVQASPEKLSELPWLEVALAIGISSLGGLGRTVNRLTPETSFRSEFLRDFITAVCVGFLISMLGGSLVLDPFKTGLAALVAGYMGRRLLDMLGEPWLTRLLGATARPAEAADTTGATSIKPPEKP